MQQRIIFIILSIFLLASCSTDVVTKADQSFWTHHSIFQLLGWVFFPRLMFWFFSVMTGGFMFWVGVFFVPRIMIAFWATTYYWDTNPVLCLVAWLCAFTGESAEKKAVKKAKRK